MPDRPPSTAAPGIPMGHEQAVAVRDALIVCWTAAMAAFDTMEHDELTVEGAAKVIEASEALIVVRTLTKASAASHLRALRAVGAPR